MKKLVLLIIVISLVGCTTPTKNNERFSLISPFGAPSIAFVETIKNDEHEITLVSGSDHLISAFVSPSSEYDGIIAPINLGLTLIKNNQTDFRLFAIVTWGNLYVVANKETYDKENDTIALFGKDSVVDLMTSYVLDDEINREFYPSVNDALAQLVSGKHQAALLAEPLVSAALANNEQLDVVLDVQQAYKSKSGFDNYPQAALFVKKENYENNKQQYDQFMHNIADYTQTLKQDKQRLVDDLISVNTDTLGLPPVEIVSLAYDGLNITISSAIDVYDEIEALMKLFDQKINKDMFLQ